MDVYNLVLSFHYRFSIILVTSDSKSSLKNFSWYGPINGPSFSIMCCYFCTGTPCGCSYFLPTLYVFVSILVSSDCLPQKSGLGKFFTWVPLWCWAMLEFIKWHFIQMGTWLLAFLALTEPMFVVPKIFILHMNCFTSFFHTFHKIIEIANLHYCFHHLPQFLWEIRQQT